MEKAMISGRFFGSGSGLLFLAVFVVMSVGFVGESDACRVSRGYKNFDVSDFQRDPSHDGGREGASKGTPPKGKAVFPKKMEVELVSANPIRVPEPGRWLLCDGRGVIVFRAVGHKGYGMIFEGVEEDRVWRFSSYPVQPIDGEIVFTRSADITKPQPAMDFVVRVKWVDRWGRESQWMKSIHVHIPAVEEVYDFSVSRWGEEKARPKNWVELY